MKFLALLSLLAFSGCYDCTTLGCGPSLTVEVYDVPGDDDGEYVFDVQADSLRWSLRCTKGATAGCAVSGTPPAGWSSSAYRARGGVWTLTVDAPPSEIAVSATRAGVTRSGTTRSITYETSLPNGAECGPACKKADVAVALR